LQTRAEVLYFSELPQVHEAKGNMRTASAIIHGRMLPGACAALALLASVSAVYAQRQLRYTAVGGPLSLYAVPGAWGQRTTILDNPTESDRLVKVVFPTSSGNETVNFTRVVSVPAGCKRIIRFAVRPQEVRQASSSEGSRTYGEQSMQLRDAGTNEVLYSDWKKVGVVEAGKVVVTNVYDSALHHNKDDYEYLKNLPGQDLGDVAMTAISMTDLPDVWYGYDAADVVLLGGLDMARIRPSQLRALADWVRRGGVMVVVSSDAAESMLSGELGALAGVAVAGWHRTERLDVTEADGKSVASVDMGWAARMLELCPDGAEVLYRANSLPLLTRRRAGLGQVFVLAAPAGTLSDESLHTIWGKAYEARRLIPPMNPEAFLAQQRAAPYRSARDGNEGGGSETLTAAEVLQETAGVRGPGRMVPASILVAIALVVAAAGVVLRRRRRGELVWLAMVPVAIVLSVVLYVVGAGREEPERISYIGLISGIGDDTARVQEVFAYCSGPQAQTLDLEAGAPAAVIEQVRGVTADVFARGEVRTAGALTLPDTDVPGNSTRAFYVDAIVATGGIEASLTFNESGLTGTVTNGLNATLRDPVVAVNRRTYRLSGPISTGEPAGVSVSEDARLGPGEYTASLLLSAEDRLRMSLIANLTTPPGMGRRVSRRLVLVGYMDRSPLDPLSGRALARQGWCMVVWPIELKPPAPGSKVSVPAGFVNVSFKATTDLWDPVNERFKPLKRDKEMMVSARTPEAVRELDDARAEILIRIRAPEHRLTVEGMPGGDRTAEGKVLDSFNKPDGLRKVTVHDANRFRSESGEYVFRLKVERTGEGGSSAGGRNAGGAYAMEEGYATWTFQSVDVSLEGTSR